METIEIDTEVFAYLQKHAAPFIDTPNTTLRRLLGIDTVANSTLPTSSPKTHLTLSDLDKFFAENTLTQARSKAPKADLGVLVRVRMVKDGEKLYLIDYQGNRVQGIQVTISGGDLLYDGRRYSMSNLAQELLTKVGFKSNSVRGPAHWVTEEGKTVKDLWQQYLEKDKKIEAAS
jgi:hypothetical protein